MDQELKEKLQFVKEQLRIKRQYDHAERIISFDQMTVCPPAGMEKQGDTAISISSLAFRIRKNLAFTEAVEALYRHVDEAEPLDAILIRSLYEAYLQEKNISPELNEKFAAITNKAFIVWSEGREKDDATGFVEAVGEVIAAKKEEVALYERLPQQQGLSTYDMLLGLYEKGMRKEILDELFEKAAVRIRKLVKDIGEHGRRIRTDFLSREVEDIQQQKMARYLMEVMGFDFERGTLALSEHPFTNLMSVDDVRITTHFYNNAFLSSIYSVIHECGHALFEQLQPREDHDYYLEDLKTLGMHESVSRFYENVIGRSRAFIHLIYPKVCEIFPQVMHDVSKEELYEAVNYVTPSLIRTEADELTYTLHIIIRYELEKELIDGTLKAQDIPARWSEKYGEYLGVRPRTDGEGALQDTHWTSDFGYFPTYALGNFYNCMYLNRMKEEFDPFEAVACGDFKKVNDWMRDHVFARANRLSPEKWILDITGRKLCAEDFLDYLEEKYRGIYGL